MNTPAFLSMHPLEIPTEPKKAAMHLFKVPVLSLRVLVSLMLPLNVSRFNTAVSCMFLVLHSCKRCIAELAVFPRQGRRYQDIISAIEELVCQYLPSSMSIYTPKTGVPLVLSDYQACVATQNLAQLLVGCLLPLTIIEVEEMVSRNAFKERNGVDISLQHSHAALIIRFLLLLPLEIGIAFQFLTLVLTWTF
jgi:hypothetical protein